LDYPENDRKNIFYTLKWLCESFQDNPNVGIVIKTNAGRNSKFDKKHVVQILTNLISSIRKGPYPKIHLLHGYMSSQQVVDLYKDPTIKALVTLTRGEGYGLPILEAAACDLPIIAPAWSGYMDFMSLGKFIKVNYVLNKIHESRVDNQLFMKMRFYSSKIVNYSAKRKNKNHH
jgi:glycosyltransferase involved in cell wall biosynthesis